MSYLTESLRDALGRFDHGLRDTPDWADWDQRMTQGAANR